MSDHAGAVGAGTPPVQTPGEAATGDGVPISLIVAVAALTAVTLELVRSTGPLLEIAFDVSVITAAGTAAVTYLGAAVVGLALAGVTRRRDGPTVLLIGVAVLVIVRLVVQALTGIARFWVGLAAISVAVAVLTFAVAVMAGRAGGARVAATAVALGAAFGVGTQLALGTWDAYWRHDPLGWLITIALLAVTAASVALAHRDPAARPTHQVRRIWVLGPVLGLSTMVMANSGFASSQSGVRLAIAGPVVAIGLLLAAAAVDSSDTTAGVWRAAVSPAAGRVTALVPVVAIAGLFWLDGAAVLALIVVAQTATFLTVARALDAEGPTTRPPSVARIAPWAGVVGLGTIVPLLVFQIDYDIPLGFPNQLVIVATALLFVAAVAHRRDSRQAAPDLAIDVASVDRPSAPVLLGVSAIVLVGASFGVGREVGFEPGTETLGDPGPITLVSWNLHYGVDPDGGVDLDRVARSIEGQHPSIVTLQEVSRGWVLGGGTDMATWLAQRLQMHVAYAPAADRQFGNVVLTAFPTSDVTVTELPYGNGPQERSAVSIDIAPREGVVLRVTSVHLQNKSHVPTRLDQIDTLLDAESGATALIVAGDFNARPGSPEIERMLDAGLTSAQDVSGDPTAMTDPSTNPDKRIDWVFGRGVSFVHTEVLADALSSDHLPLVVTFDVG